MQQIHSYLHNAVFTKSVAENKTSGFKTSRRSVNGSYVEHTLVVVNDTIVRPRQLWHVWYQAFFPKRTAQRCNVYSFVDRVTSTDSVAQRNTTNSQVGSN